MKQLKLEDLPNLVAELKKEINELKTLLLQKTESQEKTDTPLKMGEVEKLTGLTSQTIYGYCQRKEIPYYKKGNRLFFFESELIDWVKLGKQKTLKELESDAEGYLSKKKSNQLKLF